MVDDAPEPKPVELDIDLVVCRWHGEPFRAKWPSGYPTFAVMAIEQLLKDPEMKVRLAGKDHNVELPIILKARPLCCHLPKGTLLELYRALPMAVDSMCVVCKGRALGTPIKVLDEKGQIRSMSHVCFYCHLYRGRLRSTK